VRPVEVGDTPGLRAFFERVPEGDRTFFREDVLSPGVVESWLAGGVASRSVAVDDDAVIGYLAIVPDVGWSSHVGELRLVVDPGRRRLGVGRALARHGLLDGIRLGLTKLVVEVAAEQDPTIAMFRGIGFDVEALLKDHVRGRDGALRDMLLLSHFVDENATSMQAAGIDNLVDRAR
jgi:ribosomal protein S18 acetylase RimI-like enzyme